MRRHRNSRRGGHMGATLTEVLMALLVMGIGLVSVATLFPLSLVRAIEANKLTNATLLRINAEARLNASVTSGYFGTIIPRAIIEDPDNDGDRLEHDGTKFVFDPLGAAILTSDGVATVIGTNTTAFGDFNKDGVINAADFTHDFNGDGRPDAQIARFTFGYNTVAAAEEFVTLPDSFVTLADVLGGSASISGTDLQLNGPDLSEYVGQSVRVTLIHAGIRASEVFEGAAVTVTSANRVSLGRAVPASYAGNIGRVIVEVPERRFTWLATVRRIGTRPSVTIVVFFRRSFSAQDEQMHLITEPPGSYNEFELAIPAGTDPPPGLERGGWMFDAHAFRWLKIASVQEGVPLSGGGTGIRFTTDPEEEDPSIRSRIFPAMFPRNVVEAYTLKKE